MSVTCLMRNHRRRHNEASPRPSLDADDSKVVLKQLVPANYSDFNLLPLPADAEQRTGLMPVVVVVFGRRSALSLVNVPTQGHGKLGELDALGVRRPSFGRRHFQSSGGLDRIAPRRACIGMGMKIVCNFELNRNLFSIKFFLIEFFLNRVLSQLIASSI